MRLAERTYLMAAAMLAVPLSYNFAVALNSWLVVDGLLKGVLVSAGLMAPFEALYCFIGVVALAFLVRSLQLIALGAAAACPESQNSELAEYTLMGLFKKGWLSNGSDLDGHQVLIKGLRTRQGSSESQ